MLSTLFVAAGLALLFIGGEMLVRGAVTIATAFRIPPLVIGLTLVGFGTSTPELVTSLQAAFAGSPGIALGNVIGSNTGNILLILGLGAAIAPIAVDRAALARDGTVLALASLGCAALILTGEIGRLARRIVGQCDPARQQRHGPRDLRPVGAVEHLRRRVELDAVVHEQAREQEIGVRVHRAAEIRILAPVPAPHRQMLRKGVHELLIDVIGRFPGVVLAGDAGAEIDAEQIDLGEPHAQRETQPRIGDRRAAHVDHLQRVHQQLARGDRVAVIQDVVVETGQHTRMHRCCGDQRDAREIMPPRHALDNLSLTAGILQLDIKVRADSGVQAVLQPRTARDHDGIAGLGGDDIRTMVEGRAGPDHEDRRRLLHARLGQPQEVLALRQIARAVVQHHAFILEEAAAGAEEDHVLVDAPVQIAE